MKKKPKQLTRQRIDQKRGLTTKARKHKRVITKSSLTKKKGKRWVELHQAIRDYRKKKDMVK